MKMLETSPPGETHWSTRSMAKAAGVSHTMVGRIWRTVSGLFVLLAVEPTDERRDAQV